MAVEWWFGTQWHWGIIYHRIFGPSHQIQSNLPKLNVNRNSMKKKVIIMIIILDVDANEVCFFCFVFHLTDIERPWRRHSTFGVDAPSSSTIRHATPLHTNPISAFLMGRPSTMDTGSEYDNFSDKKQNMSKWISLCEQSIERITHIELVPIVALALTCAIASVFFFSFTFLNTDTEASHLRLFFVFWSECNNIEMRHAANNNRIEMVLESKCSVETNAAAFYTIDRNAQWELINYAPFFRMVNWIWRRMCRVCITIIQNVHCSM